MALLLLLLLLVELVEVFISRGQVSFFMMAQVFTAAFVWISICFCFPLAYVTGYDLRNTFQVNVFL